MKLFFSVFFGGLLVSFPALADPITLALNAGLISVATASALPSLATVGTIAAIGGGGLSAAGQVQAGKAANQSAKFQATQLEQKAGQEVATSQRAAIEKRRQGTVAISNAQAAAAGSGGGATDPTVNTITGQLAQESEYNALSALFSGYETESGLITQAKATRMEGKQAKKAGYVNAGSTIIGSVGSTLMSKYGKVTA